MGIVMRQLSNVLIQHLSFCCREQRVKCSLCGSIKYTLLFIYLFFPLVVVVLLVHIHVIYTHDILDDDDERAIRQGIRAVES